MEEVKSPNNEVSEKISEIIRDMGIEFFMNEKSLLIIDSYESKGKLYKQNTTEPRDIILCQGNLLTIYYDTTSWNF